MKAFIYGIMVIVLTVGCLIPADMFACSAFVIKDNNGNVYQGNNFDWYIDAGQWNVYPRGVEKSSFAIYPEKQLNWTSKYGSVGLSFMGREFTHTGMNEAGLMIKFLQLAQAMYPNVDDRYGLEPQQWVQYHLDMSATVDDVIKGDATIRPSIVTISAPVHYFVTDAQGNSAVIEYLNGKMVVYKDSTLTCPAVANDIYANHVKNYSKLDASGRSSSTEPVVKMTTLLNAYDGKSSAVDYSFDILQKLKGSTTQASIVFDMKNKTIYYKTKQGKTVQHIRFSGIDFSQTSKRHFIDMHDTYNGPSDLKEATVESNSKLFEAHNSLAYMQQIPYVKEWAHYPFDVNKKVVRKFKFSAAKSISDLLKASDYKSVKKEIKTILDLKTDYYYSEDEFVMYTGLMFTFGKEKGDEILAMLDIAVGLFPKSADLAYMYAGAYFYTDSPIRGVKWLKKTLEIKPDHYDAQFDMHRADNFRSPHKIDHDLLQSYTGEYGKQSVVFDKNGKTLVYKLNNGFLFPMVPIADDEFILLDDNSKGYIKIKTQNKQVVAIVYRNKKGVTSYMSKDTSPWSLSHKKAVENPMKIDKQVLASYVGEFGARVFYLKNGELYYHRDGQDDMKMIAMNKDTFIFKDYNNIRLKMIKENGKVIAVDGIYDDGTVKRDVRTK